MEYLIILLVFNTKNCLFKAEFIEFTKCLKIKKQTSNTYQQKWFIRFLTSLSLPDEYDYLLVHPTPPIIEIKEEGSQ